MRVLLHSLRRPPWPALAAVAAVGLAFSAAQAGRAALPAFCGGAWSPALLAGGGPGALRLMLELNPPARLLGEWALMLLAMMPLLLAAPLGHVRRASLERRRMRAAAGFAIGYGAVWMAAGPVLIGLALLLQLLLGGATLAAAVLIALAWSASPWQRAALNRGHRLRRIGIFGWAADRDCLAFGAVHGAWCVASCWAWMLVPLAAGRWHLAAMLLAGAAMLGQRLGAPAPPRWRLPPLPRRPGRANG